MDAEDKVNEVTCWGGTVRDFFVEGGLWEQCVRPNYQREYAWKAENVARLLQDVGEADEGYFLGTVILCAQQEGDTRVLQVVDGQQRLRTLAALLGRRPLKAVEAEDQQEVERAVAGAWSCHGVARAALEQKLGASMLAVVEVKELGVAFQLFDTQNGRGKPLSAENLLKAYHFHEMRRQDGKVLLAPPDERTEARLERQWEEEIADEDSERRVPELLTSLLFLARRGCRGEKKRRFAQATDLKEFKGITLERVGASGGGLPVQNGLALRHYLRASVVYGLLDGVVCPKLGKALEPECDPFAQVNQPIVNGEDFFVYAHTYARLAWRLFHMQDEGDGALGEFRAFYKARCLYGQSGRTGDCYARAVYEAMIVLLVDRFGEVGLREFHRVLWPLAYHERFASGRLTFEAAGKAYLNAVCQALVACETTAELRERLAELRGDQAVGEPRLSPFSTDQTYQDLMKPGK